MVRRGTGKVAVTALVSAILAACISLVSPYDPVFDENLNQLSEETAKFTAAAVAGGPERLANSPEAVEYYATTYNVLDRLSQRAELTRGAIACPTNAGLEALYLQPASSSTLPTDYLEFDCREFQLHAVRYYLDQLNYGHRNDGVLKAGEARTYGGQLQTATLGAIETFVVTK